MSDKLTSICMEIAFKYGMTPKALHDYAIEFIKQASVTPSEIVLADARALREVSHVLATSYSENGTGKQGHRLTDIVKELFDRLREEALLK